MANHPDAPEGAGCFTIQRRDPKTLKFRRVLAEWWPADQDPVDVAEVMGVGEYKAHYRDASRAINKGNGQPFYIEEEPETNSGDEKSASPQVATPAPQQTPPPQRKPEPPPQQSQQAYPVPPLPPNASPELATHVFLHSMVRQDAMLLQQQMMAHTQMVIAQAMASRDQAITSARDHYQAMQQAANAVNSTLLQFQQSSAPPVPPQLLEAIGQQSQALAAIGDRIDEMDQAGEQDAQIQALLEQAENGKPSAFVSMLQQLVPLGAHAWEQYQKQQGAAGGAGAAVGAVVDTVIDQVDSAAQ